MRPAARLNDNHSCPEVDPGPKPHVGGPIVPQCAPTVEINGRPAARVGDHALCVGAGRTDDSIVMGSPTVFICGPMAARQGDPCAHGLVVTTGSGDVFIGDGGSTSATMEEAKKKRKGLVQDCGCE